MPVPIETPTAENGVMGIAIGSALTGLRPIVTHQRVEFALLAIEQLVNQAAKWNYMTGGVMSVPIVVRLVVGRGWGQGPQHSQSLDPWFAHIPGLKVVAPATPYDAKGMLTSAIKDENPVVFIEHRWLHNSTGEVPGYNYDVPLGESRVARVGRDITIATYSYMVAEALVAANNLADAGIEVEVVDIRCYRPLDFETIAKSVRKTGRLITIDNGWMQCGIGSEIITRVVETEFASLRSAPTRLGIEDVPIPSTRALANLVYPGQQLICENVAAQLGIDTSKFMFEMPSVQDTPNELFTGPF